MNESTEAKLVAALDALAGWFQRQDKQPHPPVGWWWDSDQERTVTLAELASREEGTAVTVSVLQDMLRIHREETAQALEVLLANYRALAGEVDELKALREPVQLERRADGPFDTSTWPLSDAVRAQLQETEPESARRMEYAFELIEALDRDHLQWGRMLADLATRQREADQAWQEECKKLIMRCDIQRDTLLMLSDQIRDGEQKDPSRAQAHLEEQLRPLAGTIQALQDEISLLQEEVAAGRQWRHRFKQSHATFVEAVQTQLAENQRTLQMVAEACVEQAAAELFPK